MSVNNVFISLREDFIVLHPSCFFSVAVQGEPKQEGITYVKPKQLAAIDRDADKPYYLLCKIESYLRQLDTDLKIACNENIIPSIMENIAWIELYMKLAKQAYEKTKNNQFLWKFYKDNVEEVLSEHKKLSGAAVKLSENVLERFSVHNGVNLWGQWKAAQNVVQKKYKRIK